MKRIAILVTVILIAAASCTKEETPLTQHHVMLRGQNSLQSKSKSEGHLTPVEISKQATNIVYRVKRFDWVVGKAGFDKSQRDTVNGVLMRWATDILKLDYTLDLDFVTGKDMVLERNIGNGPLATQVIDTIGYIPNSVLENAYTLIMAAYEQDQWQQIYDIFNTEFVFIPINGAEYKELVKQGLN